MGNEGMSAGQLLKQANQLKREGSLDEAIASSLLIAHVWLKLLPPSGEILEGKFHLSFLSISSIAFLTSSED